MFLQLVMPLTLPPPPATPPDPPPSLDTFALQCVDSLFLYTPLQISALVETVWRNRYNAASATFTPWPLSLTDAILRPALSFRAIRSQGIIIRSRV